MGDRSEVSRILILDDEPDMVENCRRILERGGHDCLGTSDPARAIAILESDSPDVLVTDLRMPGMDGLEMMRRARELDPERPVIMLTAFATVESAVAAVKAGAFDYLSKPFSLDQLTVAVDRAAAQRNLMLENRNLREQLHEAYGLEKIVGRSDAIERVLDFARRAARTEANILVLGESGTGKELIAHAIHANSKRAAGPFVPVDCAALPDNLLESELFGYERGAFTGAVGSKRGLLEVAGGGTVLLDEIGEMATGLQVKLLRAIQEREIRRVGGTAAIRIDVRIVSATNRDLRALVETGGFREDLFYRINVIDLVLPPLRERDGDVSLLAHSFVERYRSARNPRLSGFAADALQVLEAYSWPGNVRELKNVIERGCALADGKTITLADLPSHIAAPQTGPASAAVPSTSLSFKQAKARWIDEMEASYVARILEQHRGNVSRAARAAGVDRTTFHRLLNKHRIR
jgi:two-component system, NtrC family, response regulator HydG